MIVKRTCLAMVVLWMNLTETRMGERALTFTEREWDQIANALAQRPYIEVNGLIAKLVNQMNSQPAPAVPAVVPQGET